jgi:hypothetical protein
VTRHAQSVSHRESLVHSRYTSSRHARSRNVMRRCQWCERCVVRQHRGRTPPRGYPRRSMLVTFATIRLDRARFSTLETT